MDDIDELDMHEAQLRMQLYNEYRDVVKAFDYYVETELRAYLADKVVVEPQNGPGGLYFKVTLTDVWIYEAERINRSVPEVVVWSVNDVHVQRLRNDKA
jgi:predicted transport protein